jgi:hypothetical protein
MRSLLAFLGGLALGVQATIIWSLWPVIASGRAVEWEQADLDDDWSNLL